MEDEWKEEEEDEDEPEEGMWSMASGSKAKSSRCAKPGPRPLFLPILAPRTDPMDPGAGDIKLPTKDKAPFAMAARIGEGVAPTE